MSGANKNILSNLPKPQVDQIISLPPAIAIKQKSSNKNTRSTVGTITDINNYLRVLFAKIGLRRCPICGKTIEVKTENEIIKLIMSLKPKATIEIKAYNGNESLLNTVITKEQSKEQQKIVKEIVLKALHLGKGALQLTINQQLSLTLQTKEMCFHCEQIMFELTASDFSFNNPESMCSKCNGLGSILTVDKNLIIQNPHLSILDGASEWWGNLRKHRKNPNANWMRGEVLALAEEMHVDLNLPWTDLPKDFQHQVIFGSGKKEVSFVYKNKNGRSGKITRPVEGAYNAIKRLYNKANGSSHFIANKFMKKQPCPKCNGERLNTASRLVSINGIRYPEVINKNITDLLEWINNLQYSLTTQHRIIAKPIINEIKNRLVSLTEVGLSYLNLNRSVPSLSGGELQRIRLASQLNNGLSNMLYVLDEPSAGLHAYDNKKLIKTLQQLKTKGNTVVVVEHNRDTIEAADNIIDIGPGAGVNGGYVVAKGSLVEVMSNEKSVTGNYLTNKINNVNLNNNRFDFYLTIKNANDNNLKNIDVKIPLGVVTCITGVSGSGKSTLLLKTLYPALLTKLNNQKQECGRYSSLSGYENIDNVIRISQAAIGRSPRSNPATYTGVFDFIREVFAKTKTATELGYNKSFFSFNSKQGQCEDCKGEGRKKIKLHFMPDIWIECTNCRGNRYKEKVLQVKYNNKSIADVLNMDIAEAAELFSAEGKVYNILKVLCDVGLGYLKLGQSSLTLSGGEAQRVKLAKELSKNNTGKTLYILDEPTAGLHFKDIEKLNTLFNTIVKEGNSLVIIEHNLEVISKADYIIDLGPYGGDQGGEIVACGTVRDIVACEKSITGQMLKEYLS
ncbi:excinuclease ABC subunit UvrA [Clostridium sp. 'deep sea']|uniref:excinuclease ABC subunit UvrA n=1 Tax=Clostridium sp. 'deep sea' TaxID=2779445 RepID=UPI0018968904|nr:excinuclease ABC subunit UvrA [Clostridium sp. 'deep sea']QOR35507.1 excinuclease ABC subunit UvrA [Clostridium sp. 'deep sea']